MSAALLLAVKARLVQDHPDVEEVAYMFGAGAPGVNCLTAAKVYVLCGRSMRRCRKVAARVRETLRLHRRGTAREEAFYWQNVETQALRLAARVTPRSRTRGKGQP